MCVVSQSYRVKRLSSALAWWRPAGTNIDSKHLTPKLSSFFHRAAGRHLKWDSIGWIVISWFRTISFRKIHQSLFFSEGKKLIPPHLTAQSTNNQLNPVFLVWIQPELLRSKERELDLNLRCIFKNQKQELSWKFWFYLTSGRNPHEALTQFLSWTLSHLKHVCIIASHHYRIKTFSWSEGWVKKIQNLQAFSTSQNNLETPSFFTLDRLQRHTSTTALLTRSSFELWQTSSAPDWWCHTANRV